ncbi:MAG: esterase, partial [Bacteroidota bacterium]
MNWKAPDEPVVFMHGMGVLAHLLAPGDVFDRIAAAARHRGVRAFAPRVPPYNPTRIRAQAWDHHCRRILAETGSQNLHLIGFSTGGLDARYLVSRLGGAGYAASVTLIATPHRGSALAEYAVALPALIRDPIFAVIDRLAETVYPESEPDVFGTLAELT